MPRMLSRVVPVALLTAGLRLFAQECLVSKWVEIPCPKNESSVEAILWDYRANYSKHEWHVYLDGGTVSAVLTNRTVKASPNAPTFTPQAESFRHPHVTLKVADGWLVGFNQGEWGGALYWFNEDGTKKYKISKHQIVEFIRSGTNILAIEGVDHMGMSKGSVIAMARSPENVLWQARTIQRLAAAPYAIARRPDGTLFVVLSESLVSVAPTGELKTLVKEGRWRGLYPNSIVLPQDSNKVYVGMRQFVAEIALDGGLVRFLVPDRSYLNQLPKEDEDRIRKTYGK